MFPSVPTSSDFCQLKVAVTTKPFVGRRVSLVCRESYQVLPNGSPETGIKPNCGYGRSACATVCALEKPAYGIPMLYCAKVADGTLRSGVERSLGIAGLLRLKPCAARIAGVIPLTSSSEGACHQTPRLPT